MLETKVAGRYAKSLLSLAAEKNILDEVSRDMELILSVCEANRDFRMMLKNPLIHADKKLSITNKIFLNKINKMTSAFLEIIFRKRREFYTENIASEFVKEFKKIKGIATATVISAVGIDDKLRAEIKNIIKNISNSEVELTEQVDKEIIGGIILRFGDVQYDSSIAKSLRLLRRNFSENLYESKIWKK